jgi:ABC-type uncharacterized transport system ATPase subunit
MGISEEYNRVISYTPDRERSPEGDASLVAMRGIVKQFPGVLANRSIDFDVKAGEIHALLGENGAGKTTLMNVLYGLYQPEEGEIVFHDRRIELGSPRDAIQLGIGMVHQHFMLVPPLTVAENVILGLKHSLNPLLDLEDACQKISELSVRYGMPVNPQDEVWQLSVGEQQRVEIIKALYRGAEVLILDEPTSVLTPQEVSELFRVLRRMAEEGKAIIFISHKLDEVMAVSHRVTVLRDGKVVATLETKNTSENELARLMVGREVLFRVQKKEHQPGRVVLQVKGLEAMGDKGLLALKDLSFEIREGECVGLAGVSGNGQRELAETISGLRRISAGAFFIDGQEMTHRSPAEVILAGLSYIPEERHRIGSIADFTVAENIILETHQSHFTHGVVLDGKAIRKHVEDLIANYDVKTPSPESPARNLSGGNLQKLILGRELSRRPKLIIAAQPTRGLDIGATEYIRQELMAACDQGTAILLISEDLNEILSLSDRIMVMYEGQIVGTIMSDEADIESLGLMMGGAEV